MELSKPVMIDETGAAECRYIAERYAPASWLIRDTKNGRIVAYPGPDFSSIARSWLKWEAGENGVNSGYV